MPIQPVVIASRFGAEIEARNLSALAAEDRAATTVLKEDVIALKSETATLRDQTFEGLSASNTVPFATYALANAASLDDGVLAYILEDELDGGRRTYRKSDGTNLGAAIRAAGAELPALVNIGNGQLYTGVQDAIDATSGLLRTANGGTHTIHVGEGTYLSTLQLLLRCEFSGKVELRFPEPVLQPRPISISINTISSGNHEITYNFDPNEDAHTLQAEDCFRIRGVTGTVTTATGVYDPAHMEGPFPVKSVTANSVTVVHRYPGATFPATVVTDAAIEQYKGILRFQGSTPGHPDLITESGANRDDPGFVELVMGNFSLRNAFIWVESSHAQGNGIVAGIEGPGSLATPNSCIYGGFRSIIRVYNGGVRVDLRGLSGHGARNLLDPSKESHGAYIQRGAAVDVAGTTFTGINGSAYDIDGATLTGAILNGSGCVVGFEGKGGSNPRFSTGRFIANTSDAAVMTGGCIFELTDNVFAGRFRIIRSFGRLQNDKAENLTIVSNSSVTGASSVTGVNDNNPPATLIYADSVVDGLRYDASGSIGVTAGNPAGEHIALNYEDGVGGFLNCSSANRKGGLRFDGDDALIWDNVERELELVGAERTRLTFIRNIDGNMALYAHSSAREIWFIDRNTGIVRTKISLGDGSISIVGGAGKVKINGRTVLGLQVVDPNLASVSADPTNAELATLANALAAAFAAHGGAVASI